MTENHNRNKIIDIMKGILIIPIVIFHLVYRTEGGVFDNLIREMVYLALPLYMLFSGYFYYYKDNFLRSIIERMRKLILPVILTVLALILIFGPYYIIFYENYTPEIWFFDNVMTFLRPELFNLMVPGYFGEQLFQNLSPVWFIWTFAIARFIFVVTMRFVKESKVKFFCAMGVLYAAGCAFYVLVPPLPWSLHLTPLYAGMMMSGLMLNRYKVIEKLSKISLPVSFIISIAAGILHYIIFMNFGTSSIYASDLGVKGLLSAIFFVIQMFIGGYPVLTIARLIEKIPKCCEAFAWIGRHTLVILLVHCIIGGLACDAMRTYNKMGPYWYLDPLPQEVVIKSVISFVISLAGSFGVCALNDMLKDLVKKKKV